MRKITIEDSPKDVSENAFYSPSETSSKQKSASLHRQRNQNLSQDNKSFSRKITGGGFGITQ